jgi:septum formation protein
MTTPLAPPALILASESRYRRELIQRLGIAVTCTAALCDEELEKEKLGPVDTITLVRELARLKAQSLRQTHPDALVIGSDQAVELADKTLGKPHTVERAIEQLESLAGRTHYIHTAVCVYHARTNKTLTALDTHALTMRQLTRAQIEDYVLREQPLDCAGSYKIEGLGIALFDKIHGDDFTAVIGLPLTKLLSLLHEFSVHALGPLRA